MKKIISKIKNHIFLTTVIFTLLFLLISFILYKNNILFRQWVYYLSGLLIYVGLILGITQLIRKIKNKIAKLISSVIFIICIILSILFLIISLIFGYQPEHVIKKNNNKYVAYVNAFLDVNVTYYDYINFFLRGSKERISEGYGNGSYDPFTFDGGTIKEPISTYYYKYDSNGNRIYENSNNIKNNYETSNNTATNSDTNNDTNYFWINELIGYKVDIVDCAMGYEGIKIYRTTDAGNSWKSQLTSEYKILSVHYNSQFLFLNDNLAFIYDPGRAGAENEKGKLMVSTNNSKTYIPCVVELPITLNTNTIYIDGLPTYENNNLKLKVYSIDYQNGPIKTYYNYTSKDGITWLYDSKAE